ARVDFQPVDLNALIDHIKDDLQLTISERKATIAHCHLPTVQGVELQLGQVFQNLISNSLKFAHHDRAPEINIDCHNEDANYVITYTDNGIGFENEMAEKIFDIFERLHPREQYEGTGIGLAIVKKILASHGGSISATGFLGKGARFDIKLPQNK
ncbi:MAG TPA: ATP-binding protein, partial [Bacteroidia bacterium]|nr:ATP-binding protein [Bacteroidia bacterium]